MLMSASLNFIHMNYIITEGQYANLPENEKALFWIKRRYGSVKEALKETFDLMKFDICRIDSYDRFENKFFSVLMDSLHPEIYDDENFDHWTYDTMFNILQDLYYVECTEFYFKGRERC
jgi:valyl-tRNA synthetase